MTDRLSNDTNRDKINQTGLLRWKNMSGETIPAYACVKLSSYNATDRYYNAVKPDGEGSLHFFNGGIPIASEKYGESFIWGQSSVLGKTSGVFGETVGPVADSWEMTTEGTGFTVFSNPDGNSVAAILKSGGGSGGSHTIWFTIVDVLCPGVDDVEEKTLVVTADEYTLSCNGIPPGANYDGTYDVTDRCNYLYGLTPADLIGQSGRATYFYPLTGYCVPKWRIDDLCPQPEC